MTQPSLLDIPEPRTKKRGHVPRTSVLAYQERERSSRVVDVIRGLNEMYCWNGAGDFVYPPTSAELVSMPPLLDMLNEDESNGVEVTLYVRRGLSDALAQGLVEHAGTRKCAVSGRTCVTWRVVGR